MSVQRPPRAPTVALVAALAMTAAPGRAAGPDDADFVQRGTHEHGKVTLNLAVEGSELSVELEAPALHVTGFERAPRTASERSRFEDAARWLRSGTGIVGVPANAGCALRSADVTLPEPGGGDAQDHDHDHAHGDSDGHGGHADYRARFSFACRNPAVLSWAEPWVLRRLSGVETLQVNLITAAGQRQLSLREPAARIPLR